MKYVVPCLLCNVAIELDVDDDVLEFTAPCCGARLVFDQRSRQYMTRENYCKRWCIHEGLIYGREMCN